MSAESGEGGGFWNKLQSFFGVNNDSNNPNSNSIPEGYPNNLGEELDEIVVQGTRKQNWFQRNFSIEKLVSDWKKIKENYWGESF